MRLDTTGVSPLITESLSEPLYNPGSAILEDVVIHDSDEEPVLVEADPGCRSGAIEVIRGQSFYERSHFCDVLKEFTILNNFELQHIKTDSVRVTTRCRATNCTWRVHASAERDTQNFVIRRFCNGHIYNTLDAEKNHRQAKSRWIASIIRDRIFQHPRTTLVEIRTDMQRDYGLISVTTDLERGKKLH